jgi:alpha-galactosidase
LAKPRETTGSATLRFKPLGLDVIQLDHGWQRGDICGDWVLNERFPHGLKWLSEQLGSRHGMKLGLWIAPTQVAFTSQFFREHPEWMLQDARGKPAGTGRWFWVPNPEMAMLDASHPAAEQWIEATFARLSAEGAAYYKNDFIAGSPALGRAMAAIHRGAGPAAWIRYCQTPPLLSAGLANSAYIGADTGDAGLPDWMNLERQNAPLLAASYWANDRLYRREICDMSVGAKAGVEEARFKLSLMTLGGCSISFSDDFRLLQPPRIRMMQQCLPQGRPAGRPLDLFERERPSLWHAHCKSEAGKWDAVRLFNFEEQPQERTVELSALGLPAGTEVAVFEFWEEKFLGLH